MHTLCGVVIWLLFFGCWMAAAAPGLVERSPPIRKTVLTAPPLMDRRLALFANEAAGINARLTFLHSGVDRLARQATEKDAQWIFVHRSQSGGSTRYFARTQLAGTTDRDILMEQRVVSCDFAPITCERAPKRPLTAVRFCSTPALPQSAPAFSARRVRQPATALMAAHNKFLAGSSKTRIRA